MRHISEWEASGLPFGKGRDVWGIVAVKSGGLDIGFLVELGWASLIIALREKGQFALLLFSRVLKFLFLSGPVMDLKHVGTPATICPKSHSPILSIFVTMHHFDGEQKEAEGVQRVAHVRLSMTVIRPCKGLQEKWQCLRVLCVSLELCHHLWAEQGVRRPCVSQCRRVCLFWLVNSLFVRVYFFWCRELDTTITNAWPNSAGFKMERVCFFPLPHVTFFCCC
jgi:hypothetical protein